MITLPGDLTREQLASPAAAVARQAALDAAVERAFASVLDAFLRAAYRLAVDDGLYTSAGAIYARWGQASEDALRRSDLPDVVREYAAATLAESDVPGAAYDAIRTVSAAAVEQQWPDATRRDQLRLALQPDVGETTMPALTAAARPRHGAPWDQLDQGGLKFMDRMKRDARTAVTGLDGMLTSNALRDKGFTRKRWVTKHDAKVRDTHRGAEGQTVELASPFDVGGYPLMYPGERGAPPAVVINCRCVMVGTRWRATDRSGVAGLR